MALKIEYSPRLKSIPSAADTMIDTIESQPLHDQNAVRHYHRLGDLTLPFEPRPVGVERIDDLDSLNHGRLSISGESA